MMSGGVKNVVFDLGGVLIDWNPEHLYRKLVPNAAEREVFLTEVCTRDWHYNHDKGVPFSENAKELLNKYSDNARITALILDWKDRFNEMNKGPIQGTVDILTRLHGAGVGLYALTNWAAEFFPPPKELFPFLSLFKEIVVSGIERVAKPDPAIYRILLMRTGIVPSETLFIDDRKENLDSARDLGIQTLLFTTAESLERDLATFSLPVSFSRPQM